MVSEAIATREQALERLQESLSALVKRGESIEVRDQTTDIQAKQFKTEVKSYEKAVDLYADGDIQDAKERLSRLQNAKKMLLAPAQTVLETVERKRKAWEEQERRNAEAEQARLQEQARIETQKKAEEERRERERQAEEDRKKRQKEIEEARKAGEIKAREADRLKKESEETAKREKEQAERDAQQAARDVPQITVMPAIPKVSGVPSRRNWKFKIVDETQIPRFFLGPNLTAIGEMVRRTQDKETAEKNCPGIQVWSE